MMCGSSEVNGYVFCLGLKSLRKSQKLSSAAFLKLQSLSSLTYLIERAGFRPENTTNSLGKYSLEIRPLAELVDMFHTRQASDPLDKVYALLGMSSDDPSKAGLQPDYTISWEELFQQLIKFILGKDVSMETFSQRAVIKSKGRILGQVSSVRRDDRQNVIITSRNAAWDLGGKTEWTLQASAKPIQERDIICRLYGASKPTIIRLCKDHFAVIVIAVSPLTESGSFGWPETSQSITQSLRDFLLVWDWENPQGFSQGREEYETLIKIYSQVLEYSKAEVEDYLGKAIRLWNDIMILDDLGEYEEVDERLLEARSGYTTAFGKEHLPRLNSPYGRTLLSFVAGEGHEDVVKLLLEKVDPDLKDGKYSQTPLSRAAENGYEAVVKLLLETGKVDVDSKDKSGQTPLSRAAGNGHKAVVKLLLENGVNVNSQGKYCPTPLWRAVENRHEAVVKLLLENDANVNSQGEYGRTPLWIAVENGHEAMVKLLLENDANVNSQGEYGRTPLWIAVENEHEAIVKLLLENGANVNLQGNLQGKYSQTPLSKAVKNGHEAIVKLLLEKGANVDSQAEYGRTSLWIAVVYGREAIIKLLLEKGTNVNSQSKNGQTPLWKATENGHEAIVKLLLEKGVNINS